MNLLLDLGNSRCKYAIAEKDSIKKYAVQRYHKSNRLSIIESLLHENVNTRKVIVCSVLHDNFNQQLKGLFHSHQIHEYYFLDPAVNSFGIQLGYRDTAQLGADRLAALIAANEQFSGNRCIVDCGTAITVDMLDTNGMHRGGVILPGFASMQQALCVDTDIKHNKASKSFNIFAQTTQDAIQTGCLSAVVGGIQHVVNIMQAHYDSFDEIIITGGDAELVKPFLTLQVVHEPTLVLDGLIFVYRNL